MNSWIIKEKLDLESILPVVDNLTDTLTELDLGKNTRSTQGPASQQWELIGCTENNWLDLMQEMKEKIKVLYKEKFDKDILLACIGAWTVKGQEYSYHTLHSHQKKGADVSKRISTVTYLRMPEKRWAGDGAFYFVENKDDTLTTYHIDPEIGTFIIMPSNLLHGAYPQPAGTRQTLNLDFELKEATQ